MIADTRKGVLRFPKAANEGGEKRLVAGRRKGSLPPPKVSMPDITGKHQFIEIGDMGKLNMRKKQIRVLGPDDDY